MKLKKLSDATHQRLLSWKPEPVSARAKKQMGDTWAEFGLDNAVDRSELVELELPEWLQTYDKVAETAVKKYGKRSLARLNKFSRMDTPDLPPVKPPRVNGWQRWSLTQKCNWQMSGSPKSDSAMVLDFETVEVSEGRWMPICCVVLTDEFWYVWQADINGLQPLLDFSKDQVIVAHNAGYDRSFLKPEYYYQESGNMFFDTMAAWIATRGFCNQQRIIYATSEEDSAPGWVNETATNGLDAVYAFYTGGKLDKGVRDLIVNQGIPWLRQPGSLQEVTWYCIKDVLATFEVFRYVYPEWRNSQPSEVSQTAQLLLGNTWLPLSGDRYPKYYDRAEAKYNEVLANVQERINQLCIEVLNNPTQVQLDQLDWTPGKTGKTKGIPKWFRDCKGKPKVTERVAPILLSCTWRGKPILWDDDLGWHTSDGAIPHPEKQGKKVTSLFVKGMETAVEQGVLDAPGGLKDLLQSLMSTINWKSLRDRVKAMKVENLEGFPVCLPRINVTGTVTRRCADNMWQIASNPKRSRIGTELKSLVEAPEGYTFVGADVASQELWIAASLGDALTGYCGATALGLMTLIGVKADKTDPHSVVAAKVGISRDLAKNILYGCVPMDTQALTRSGWKTYDHLQIGDEILAYNPETGLNEWTPILHLTYHDDAVVMQSELSDGWTVRSTPDHRWYGDIRRRKGDVRFYEPCVMTTSEIVTESRILVAARAEDGVGIADIPPNKYKYDWCAYVLSMTSSERKAFLAGVLVADGNWCDRQETWFITQKRGNFSDAMQLAMYLEGYMVRVFRHSNDVDKLRFCKKKRVTGQRLKHKFIENQPVWCPTTKFGTWVMKQGKVITITGNCIYGLGQKGVTDYIAKSNPLMPRSECESMAKTLLNLVKGYKSKHTGSFVGGLGSESFNVMDEIADSDNPTTPILKARMSKALAGQEDFKTTRTNWVIQSSGVDFRDLLVLYTRYCFEQLGVRGRLLLTIHDELRTIVVTEDTNKAAYALQLAHLLTRAYFTDALGLDCIPAGVAWFPEIDADKVLRKDPTADQVTPSQPEAIKPGYCIKPIDLTEYLATDLVMIT